MNQTILVKGRTSELKLQNLIDLVSMKHTSAEIFDLESNSLFFNLEEQQPDHKKLLERSVSFRKIMNNQKRL